MLASESAKSQSPESFVYTGLIESYLGKRAALISSVLISYGRLSARELSKKSKLSPSTVKKTLVSLIQLNCVSVWVETTLKSETTYYYFKEDGALALLYSGEIIGYVDKLYNNDSLTQIVSNFLSLGNLSINDYLSSFGSDDKEEVHQLEKHFASLVTDKFLIPISKTHFNPLKDLWLQTYKKAYGRIPKTSTLSELKRKAEAKAFAKLEFLKIVDYQPESLIIKDKSTSSSKINPNISLSFNIQRFLKYKRSVQLTHFCCHRIGKVTSVIYESALLATDKNTPPVINPLHQIGLSNEEFEDASAYEPKNSCTFNARDVLKHLPTDFILNGTILNGPTKRKASDSDTRSSSKRVKLEEGFSVPELNGEDHSDDEVEDSNTAKLAIVEQHLKILTNSTIPFLKKAQNGLYYVPFPEVLTLLKRSVYDSVISSTLGAPCARILRCVRDNRLVSEKLINSVALLREKDARSLTATLVKYNSLQIQEIPKSADRAASKSVFLYRFNEKHSFDFLKSNVCWNMGQLLEKIDCLKQENSGLITKINRDDVKGKEMDYLLPSELTQLKELKDRELDGVIKINRLTSIWEVFKFF
ncbi:hypothetical protein WICANDRAFT_52808 [Wickerhamomyces anomalus NRRL Y-366-8]|uniref:DNA-directed RNA polymerase III subunit RPC3 n=1 Tax=Wickerhamomyces anomalus (strain ATCC 58044 / CBS 1984 / NCYC 433 / NRRL Y-366-8) TaxID=683960 RepID=A0A1E3P232_WICAA|nr:uncharacterized protein WICANDRAFT_52808 [Wickerhamomyces anomalus NRRL Y-366-8]ODQ59521.1 hypothetical protein WICANDRAFT_52808 [Wickerhamomyces anomalus NRRL Y-366-8]